MEREIDFEELLTSLKRVRLQATYLTLEDIVIAIKTAFPEEYKIIAEKLTK